MKAMTMHNHPQMTHEHGLQSDCPRCEQYVADPLQLDETNLRRVWQKPQTQLDRQVQAKLYSALVTAQRVISSYQFEGIDTSSAESMRAFEKHPPLTVDQLFDIYHGKTVEA